MSEWRLDLPHHAEAVYKAVVYMAERGEPFELYVNYREQKIRVEKHTPARSPHLIITFMSDGVRIRVNGRIAKEDAERIFMAALTSKLALFSALEKFIQLPLLIDITVW